MEYSSVYDVLSYINSHFKTTKEKGDMWERAVMFYLRNDPEMRQVMSASTLWEDAPTNDGHDTGIDIVAEYDGAAPSGEMRYWAVQCKNYDPSHKMDYKELSTFWAKAEADERYAGYAVVSASGFSKTAYDHANKTGTLLITPEKMDESSVDWNAFVNQGGRSNRPTFDLREHQERAVERINASFEENDRCKAVLACGTGKTLMSLRLAEGRCPHGNVLFCAPSIALVSQAMREWTNQARVNLRSLVVCSDAKASATNDYDDVIDTLADLAFPASTNPDNLRQRHAYIRSKEPDAMVVTFTTYQSMQVVADAQAMGLPDFDLIVCDEAHRTTGVKATEDEDVTPFLIVHDQTRVHGDKRLYMTATPRIYGGKARETARERDYVLTSMDDEGVYGPTAYEITFSEAVERELLCDYRVVVLAVREETLPADMQLRLSDGSEMQLDDAAKIVGCYKGLATHGVVSQRRIDAMFEADSSEVPDFFLIDDIEDVDEVPESDVDIEPLHRAVGFCRSIQDSKNINEMFPKIVSQYNAHAHEGERYDLECELGHVDGGMNSKERMERLSWLSSGSDDQECRILTNARCLAEGVDVPSLDAVIFFSPRKSEVDVVQAVGRVMRTFEDPVTGERKKLGYIILPVFIPANMSPEEALNRSETFDVVWKVLQALRSHDERIEAYVNSLQFRKKKEKGVGIGDEGKGGQGGTETVGGEGEQLQLDFSERIAEAIYTKAVDKVGTRIYWDSWAADVAHIAERHIEQIHNAITTDPVARSGFDSFIKGLRDSLNPGISEDDAIEMVAQHMITLPVFDALFGDFEFAESNPVSVAITEFLKSLAGHGVGDMSREDEASLDALYSSVARRAKMARTDNGRQALIKNLYEEFFRKAFKATTDKLGIVYTPDEIIDYILRFTDRLLRREFGKSLADEGVHILDPFAGTGSFTARLIEDETLMPGNKLPHKYAHELHSNEILLLAYYIMVVNIEYAYHSRTGEYREFQGALLTDTFQMTEKQNQIDKLFFVDNSIRQMEQAELDITVIVGNPPYSAGQQDANDNSANEHYQTLEDRIRETYTAKSRTLMNRALMDSYVKAFRWASDRIVNNTNSGIVSFVSNAGWIRAAAGSGIRRSFVEEFNSIYVFDLRGNQRTQGEESRKEGGKVFGSGSRAPIAITTLVKNPTSEEHGVIRYFDVGDYKTREEKLALANEFSFVEPNWVEIVPDRHDDWLNKREESWYKLAPMGIQDGGKKTPLGIWRIWSSGIKTQRDVWAVSFDYASVKDNMEKSCEAYLSVLDSVRADQDTLDPTSKIDFNNPSIKWPQNTVNHLKRNRVLSIDDRYFVLGAYRPFCKEWMYVDRDWCWSLYYQPSIFPIQSPHNTFENIVISVPVGRFTLPIISEVLPDIQLEFNGQCFPYYYYEPVDDIRLFDINGGKVITDAWGNHYARRDAITDTTLAVFQRTYPNAYMKRAKKYGGPEINKEDIFYYVYGVLHSPEYRQRFASNLTKELPRIPLAEDFEGFSEAGRRLADLHLHYENLTPWPTVSTGLLPGVDPGKVTKMRWAKKKDPETGKRVDDHTTLIFNANVTITGIPETAQSYVVNGRSPIDWMIDRYQVKTDKKSGITNDPNDYSDDPCYIVDLVGKLVRVAMETNNIVATLPSISEVPHPDNWPAEWSV